MRTRSIVYVTRGRDGIEDRVEIPMRYVYVFLASALVGMFTIAGMAGSYGRMLSKAETINRLRDDLASSRRDYQHLQKESRKREVQAASLGSLATEVSAIYGLTAGKLQLHPGKHKGGAAAEVGSAALKDDTTVLNDEAVYKSIDTFYALRETASSGAMASALTSGQPLNPDFGVRGRIGDLAAGLDLGGMSGSAIPDMWPIMGPINSGFGQREDPVLGMGVGEFHKGLDIGSPDGTPIHAPADGRVIKAAMGSGYGREIQIDHGNGIVTVYGHLQGWNVSAGEQVVKGQVIGFVGHSGKTTGSHLHYEVQVRGTAVNPHRFLRTTLAQLGGGPVRGF